MYELTVIVPTTDNSGKTLQPVIELWESFILDTAGGFTREAVSGAWKDASGKVYRDSSYRYTIVGKVGTIRRTIPAWCAQLGQEAMYTSVRRIAVSFVEPVKVAA
jgi:hypothetical protein